MIPVLYSPETVDFSHNGLGLLTDALTCFVPEELNGGFELMMTYPVDGVHAEEIEVDYIIKAEPRENADKPEPFRIYRISRNITGQLTIYAQHITYQMSLIPIMPIAKTSWSANAALQAIAMNAVGTSPWDSSHLTTIYASPCTFTLMGWESAQHDFEVKEPTSLRSVLGGVEGSIIDTYNAEIMWSYPQTYIMEHRGSDNGIVVEYGRNMISMTNDDTMSGVITGICPYCRNTVGGNEQILTLTEKIIESEYASVFPFKRTVCVDLSDKFTDNGGQAVTEAQLRTAAQEYVSKNCVGVPTFSIEVSLINPNHDLGYTLLNQNNTISLGDTVTVKYSALDLVTTERVRKLIYNVLLERYESVTVGKPIEDLSNTIVDLQEENTMFF